jgi:polyisoprenoid-binding protein YceI
LIALGTAAAVLVVAGIGGWYFFIRDDSPPPVSLADAVASLTDGTVENGDDATPETTATGTPDPATIVTPTAASAASQPTSDPTTAATSERPADVGLAGSWVLASGANSFVGYRVAEELSTLGVTTAVGRTSDLSATLTFDGTAITAVEVEANLAALTSDDDRRDRTLGRQALESNTFPSGTFSLTEPIVLESEPVDGVPIAATAVGDLTLHGVTRSVAVALEGQLVGDQVVVIGSTEIVFADFDIDPPTAIILVSVADEGTMEFQLILERA